MTDLLKITTVNRNLKSAYKLTHNAKVLHFPSMLFGPSFSSPAFSTPPNVSIEINDFNSRWL